MKTELLCPFRVCLEDSCVSGPIVTQESHLWIFTSSIYSLSLWGFGFWSVCLPLSMSLSRSLSVSVSIFANAHRCAALKSAFWSFPKSMCFPVFCITSMWWHPGVCSFTLKTFLSVIKPGGHQGTHTHPLTEWLCLYTSRFKWENFTHMFCFVFPQVTPGCQEYRCCVQSKFKEKEKLWEKQWDGETKAGHTEQCKNIAIKDAKWLWIRTTVTKDL